MLFFVPTTLVMHNFWALDSAAEAQQQMAHFYKNIALLGSALILVAIPRPWPASFARSSKSSRTGYVPDAAEVGA